VGKAYALVMAQWPSANSNHQARQTPASKGRHMNSSGTAPRGNYDIHHPAVRTFHDCRADFLAGRDTPREYLERCLATIDEHEGRVRAWVCLNTEGAREAANAATQRYRSGMPLSAIDGMPVGIKDVLQTHDMPTTLGSPIFAGRQTGMDSASVNALRLAGAAVVGKTVTTEFAFMVPGPTTNPYCEDATPGGSSSGSAAAVGAGMVPVALGNQVVGSVIRPAGYWKTCGQSHTRLHSGPAVTPATPDSTVQPKWRHPHSLADSSCCTQRAGK